MIQLHPAHKRGHSDENGIRSNHSFAVQDSKLQSVKSFGVLTTLSEDWFDPAQGAEDTHHADVEILHYVLQGALGHKDSLGNDTLVRAGDLQLLSAGCGVLHSEINVSPTDPLHCLQMRFEPEETGLPPRYEQRHFQYDDKDDRIFLLASPDGRNGSLTVQQDVCVYNIVLNAGEVLRQEVPDGRRMYLHVARGSVLVNDQVLQSGDGAGITDEDQLKLLSPTRGEALLFDLP